MSNEQTNPNPILLKIREVATALRVSKSTVYVMVAKREIPSIKIRGGLRIPAQCLNEWILQKLDTNPEGSRE